MGPAPRPVMERFLEKTEPVPFSGCWLWLAATYGDYGQFKIRSGLTISAHRASWILHYGEIPDDLFVLHKCDVKICVNPRHLFLGTNQDNLVDYVGKNPGKVGAHNARKTHCVNGHAYTEENTGRDAKGYRFCRRCAHDKARRYLKRKETSNGER